MYVHRFTMVGRGIFPMDMLRYDQCWPEGAGDVLKLETPRENREPREVNLVHYSHTKAWNPTQDRWRTFGWTMKVDSHSVEPARK